MLWVNSHCWVNCTVWLPVNCSLFSEKEWAGIAVLVVNFLCSACDGCSDTVRQIPYFTETRVWVCSTQAVKEVISQNICSCFVLWSVGAQCLDITSSFWFLQLLQNLEKIMKTIGGTRVCMEVESVYPPHGSEDNLCPSPTQSPCRVTCPYTQKQLQLALLLSTSVLHIRLCESSNIYISSLLRHHLNHSDSVCCLKWKP